MKIYPITVNAVGNNEMSFKAQFVKNGVLKELLEISPKEDVLEFDTFCNELAQQRNDYRMYVLSGETLNNGFSANSEVCDKYIGLSCLNNGKQSFIRSWGIRNENIISGGCEKKNVLKEVILELKQFAKKSPVCDIDLRNVVIKKATKIH